MAEYRIYEPTPEDVRRRRADWLYWFDQFVGRLNLIDTLIGEGQLATDSRSKRRRQRGAGRLRIVLHREAPHTPADVVMLLNRYGIRVRKYLHDGDNFYFTVRSSQADWAIEVLERWKSGTLGASWREKADERRRERRGPGVLARLLRG